MNGGRSLPFSRDSKYTFFKLLSLDALCSTLPFLPIQSTLSILYHNSFEFIFYHIRFAVYTHKFVCVSYIYIICICVRILYTSIIPIYTHTYLYAYTYMFYIYLVF